jgi:hypothetical protein
MPLRISIFIVRVGALQGASTGQWPAGACVCVGGGLWRICPHVPPPPWHHPPPRPLPVIIFPFSHLIFLFQSRRGALLQRKRPRTEPAGGTVMSGIPVWPPPHTRRWLRGPPRPPPAASPGLGQAHAPRRRRRPGVAGFEDPGGHGWRGRLMVWMRPIGSASMEADCMFSPALDSVLAAGDPTLGVHGGSGVGSSGGPCLVGRTITAPGCGYQANLLSRGRTGFWACANGRCRWNGAAAGCMDFSV